MSDDVFTSNQNGENESALDALVGEDKKFNDVEGLAKGKQESDAHITKLEGEASELKTQLEKLQKEKGTEYTVADLMKAVREVTAKEGSEGGKPMSNEELQEVIKSVMDGENAANTKAANRAQGNKLVLDKVDGNVEAAKALVAERAGKLGMSPAKLAEMTHVDEGKRERWNNQEIMVDHPLRKAEGVRDATVFTAGLTTSITGLHCNIAVLDDVVVIENAYTIDGRSKVESQYSLLASIETTDAKEWIVGTRYHPKDLYGTLIATTQDVVNEDGDVLDREAVYEVYQKEVEDMGDGTGQYLWPRQQRGDGRWFGFNPQILATKRAKYLDRTQFHAQYYNNPNDPHDEAIDSKLFQYYNREMIAKRDGVWTYNGQQLAIFASIDFAFSLRHTADYTVVVVVGIDSDGNIYILDIKRKRTNKTKEYYDLIRETHLKWGYKKIRAEVTAAQSVIAERIKDDIREEGLVLAVDDFRPTRTMGTKDERIHAALSPRYENRTIWHFSGGLSEELEQELTQHNPAFDDIKDALHSVMGIIRVPTKRGTTRRRSNIITHSRFGGVAA